MSEDRNVAGRARGFEVGRGGAPEPLANKLSDCLPGRFPTLRRQRPNVPSPTTIPQRISADSPDSRLGHAAVH